MGNRDEKKKSWFLSLGLIIFALCVTGATYAYFALTASNNAITGTVGGATLRLTVTKVVPTTATTNMIPQLESTLGDAISSNYNCVDENGNVVCQVYKATIINNGDTSAELTGTISFTNISNMPNLKWMRLDNATTIGTYTSSYATSSETIFEESKLFAPDATQDYYFVIWIDETGELQTDTGTFRATINFNTADGDGLTSTIKPEPNAPNLDDGNLIPVYYDDTTQDIDGTYGVWRKADSTNPNNSWYDYDNKEWANAILLNDSTITATYQVADVNTIISLSDIKAFYVWIPRYKYRVWNITRQAVEESAYSYPAYSEGIDIEWEKGTASTGNIVCNYNINAVESDTNLSDECVYNGDDTITTTSGNTNYTDAWYTHPAFNYHNEPKTGFWIGKYETSEGDGRLKVLPDLMSIVDEDIGSHYSTLRAIGYNILSDNIFSSIMTNLEWGAIAYLTHSKYGLCNETECRDIHHNNSSIYYTGRSGGAAVAKIKTMNEFYGSDITTSAAFYNDNGYYNYKGYMLDIDGNITSTKDINSIASTTGNVFGVYDMNGGAQEYVLGNMVDSTGNFSSSDSGLNFFDSYDFYDYYSYSESNSNNQIAFNRSRLGDASAEILVLNDSTIKGWTNANNPGSIMKRMPRASNDTFWISRGGASGFLFAGLFEFEADSGYHYEYYTCRSALR